MPFFPKSDREKELFASIANFKITNPAQFLGQVAQESAMLTKFIENMNYTPAGLLATFPSRVTPAQAAQLGRTDKQQANQRAIANLVYGGRNGNTAPNDGWDFRGHGAIQLTGRDAHLQFSKFVGRPEIMLNPELVATDKQLCCDAAAWFWTQYKKINGITDVAQCTRLVTGSASHFLAERQAYTLAAIKYLG